MAGGWSNDGSVQEQIDATVEDAVRRARSELPSGQGRSHCEACGEAIPAARRAAVPGVRFCIACQAGRDEQGKRRNAINRRASKDSLLR